MLLEFIKKIILPKYIDKTIDFSSIMGNPNFKKQFENIDEAFEASRKSCAQREQFKKDDFKRDYIKKYGKKYNTDDFWSIPEVAAAFFESRSRSNDNDHNSYGGSSGSDNDHNSCSGGGGNGND